MTATIPALALTRVRSGYGEATVIRDVDLTLGPGEIVALLGKNGMGKSTLLKTIMGYLPVMAGEVALAGERISGLSPHRIARRAVAYSPQDQPLFQDLSVLDNLRVVCADDRALHETVRHLGRFFPFLPERLAQRAGTLSGGEQKMLLVARALASRPKIMLMDEITEGLQPSVIHRLTEVLRAERARLGLSILLVEQNVRFALAVADRYAVLKRGEIIDAGRVDDPGAEARITDHLSV
ncbi:ABC transporter ATP-binding protein [Azospirillum sp. ST 5-10]|uniref:ABC transporter ATP-binding protein n=1 Tax=unclassified Azospirillum TaxID=2630922 RepID=UPI003F4A7585